MLSKVATGTLPQMPSQKHLSECKAFVSEFLSLRDEDKVLESSLQREKESERKEQEARLHEEDVAYKSVLRKWEAEEM